MKLAGVTDEGEVRHVLSHRRLEVAVLGAEIKDRGRVAARGESEYVRFELVERDRIGDRGVSTLARKILGVIKVS
jgi:hypothetical protein